MRKYFQAPWTLNDLFKVLISAGIGLSLIFFISNYFEITEIIGRSDYKAIFYFVFFVIQWSIIGIPLYLVSRKKKKISPKSFGFQHVGFWHTILMIIGAYLIFLGISFIVAILIIYTGIEIPGYQVQEKILPTVGDSIQDIVIMGVIIVGLAPIFEEIFFRGFILRTIVNKIGVWWGNIATAILFGVFHFQFLSIIPLIVLGIIINSMMIRSRSIYPSLFFHIFNNAIAFTIEILLIKDIISLDF